MIPSIGEFSSHLDRNGFPQVITKKGSDIYFRAGPWDGVRFSGVPILKPNPYKFGFVSTDKELYYHYELEKSSVVAKMVLNPLGYIQRYVYMENSQSWQLYSSGQIEGEDMELPIYNFATIANATNNISISSKLGQGGLGLFIG